MGVFRLSPGGGEGPQGPPSLRDLPPSVVAALSAEVSDLEDRLRVLDALYIPTRYPDSPGQDALSHARALVDAICAALAPA